MTIGYRYILETEENGWWLVRFPAVPEALTEGETEAEARTNAADCLRVALEGYMQMGRSLPRASVVTKGTDFIEQPSFRRLTE